jgi:hypothetical protein
VEYGSVGFVKVLLVLRGVSVQRVVSKYTGAACTVTLFIGIRLWSKTDTNYTEHKLLMHCSLEITGQLREVIPFFFFSFCDGHGCCRIELLPLKAHYQFSNNNTRLNQLL